MYKHAPLISKEFSVMANKNVLAFIKNWYSGAA